MLHARQQALDLSLEIHADMPLANESLVKSFHFTFHLIISYQVAFVECRRIFTSFRNIYL